jgi:hypothetical protein
MHKNESGGKNKSGTEKSFLLSSRDVLNKLYSSVWVHIK